MYLHELATFASTVTSNQSSASPNVVFPGRRAQAREAQRMKESLSVTNTVVLTVIMTVIPTVAEVCEKVGDCKCNAGSFTVDLTQLLDGENPRFVVQDPKKSDKYYYMPCHPLDTTNNCKTLTSSMAICQVTSGDQYAYDLGDIITEKFSGDPMSGTLNVTYQAIDPDGRNTSIMLQCGDDTRMEFISESPTKTYNFRLYTSLVCTGTSAGLSIGSVLVIIFFVTFALYWIFGVLFMKFVRRAQGMEMIPNLEFWKELPFVIRDGFAFTFRGCKGETTYEKI